MTTFATKWGPLTGQQWIRRRFTEALNDWLTPEVLHHAFLRLPYLDSNGQEIVDRDFIYLLNTDPDAALQQLEHEGIAYHLELAIRDRRRAEQPPAPQLTHKQHSLL